jgi:uncharacterized protein
LSIFVDTSAFLALLDRDEVNHRAAAAIWTRLVLEERFFSTSYVLVETYALVQRRLGLDAVRTFTADFVPLIDVDWVDADLHAAAVSALLVAARRDLSLVDCVSFASMRRQGVRRVFAFDEDFSRQGFEIVRGPSTPP